MTTIKKLSLTDNRIEALVEFGTLGTFKDDDVKGLRLRVGKRRLTWLYFQEHRIKGDRSTTCKRLGFWPSMNVARARKDALVKAGEIAAGRLTPGSRKAIKFNDAVTTYLDHLRAQSKRKGKPARWAYAAESIARLHLLPVWAKWSLIEMSDVPTAVRDWHRKLSAERGEVIANKAAKLMRSVYTYAAKEARPALPTALPTSAVTMNTERPKQISLPVGKWPQWLAAWRNIKSPVRRAYWMFVLLTGTRPGEAIRLQWKDIDCRKRIFTIRAAKAGYDVTLPLSIAIVRALRLARDSGGESEFVFPGKSNGHLARSNGDGLPLSGNGLRHNYRLLTVECGVQELVATLLTGHAPPGVSAKYVSTLALSLGPAMRTAQAKISRHVLNLLGAKTF
jgi:integrase